MSKKKQKTKQVYVMPSGEEYEVVADAGKYFVCATGTQFRKSAKRGTLKRVEIAPDDKKDETEG